MKLCTIEADLSDIVSKPMRGDKGKAYYRVDYDIVLLFGLTELKAQVAWDENVCHPIPLCILISADALSFYSRVI